MDLLNGILQSAGALFPAYWTSTYVASLACIGLVFLGVLLFLWERRREHTDLLMATGYVPHRRGRALKRQREKYVDGLLANDFIEMIQYRLYHREITPDEAQRKYRQLASLLSYRGLYPSTADLKALIKLRLANKEKKADIPGKPEPVPALPKTEAATAEVIPMFSFSKKVA